MPALRSVNPETAGPAGSLRPLLFLCLLPLNAVMAPPVPASEPPPPHTIGAKALKKGDPMPAILALKAREKEYLSSSLKVPYLEHIGVLYSRVGEYWQALASFDRRRPPRPDYSDKEFGWLRAEPALPVILAAARSRRAVFINEDPYAPRHRMFSLVLLKELRKLGFDHFAAETLSAKDTKLVHRGYPLLGVSGGYTDEPVFGDLVRTAIRLGFKVIPYYPPYRSCKNPPGDREHCANLHEKEQAENLARVLDGNPNARIFVHAGYGHIGEKSGASGWTPMALAFHRMTGLDPLTIDQTGLTEHSSREYESPAYRAVFRKEAVTVPSVLRAPDGAIWTEEWRGGTYDVQVVHPRSVHRKGRPDWLFAGTGRKPAPVPPGACKHVRPCLIQAFYEDENYSAVPVDQIMVQERETSALALPEGKFKVRALSPDGKTLSVTSISN